MARYSASRNQYLPEGIGGDSVALYPANGAIAATDGTHALTKTSAGAYQLSTPGQGDDGARLVIVSRTPFAHVVTVIDGLGGNAGQETLTFAKVGDNVELMADNYRWIPLGVNGVVMS